MTELALSRLRTLSVLELLYLPLLMLPSASALAVMLLLAPIALVVVGACYVTAMLVGGSLVSAIFGLLRKSGQPLSLEWRKRVETAIADSGILYGHDIASRFRSARLSDLTVGAFVHAALRAQIVASGGLLVQVLRRSPSSQAIVAHEYAHIRHFDRLYFMILLIYIANIIISPILFIYDAGNTEELSGISEIVIWWMFNIFATTVIVSQISKRRELGADFAAALIVGRQSYVEMLEIATGRHASHETGFFHPSVEQRKAALITMRVRRPSGLLISAYCFLLVSYLLQAMVSGDETAIGANLAQAFYCAIGLALEQFRRILPTQLP